MVTITLTNDEHRLLVNALRSFLTDFGHDEADVVREVQRLLTRLSTAQTDLAPAAE